MRLLPLLAITFALTGCIHDDASPFDDAQDSSSEGASPAPERLPIPCEGGPPILAITSAGGFFESELEPKQMPYGHLSWYVSGRCEVRRCQARKTGIPGGIQGAALNPEQLTRAKNLAQDPALALFDKQRFSNLQGTCEGSEIRVSNLRGSFHCACSCDPQTVKLPGPLRTFFTQLQELRDQSQAQLRPLEIDLGLLAISQSSPLWGHPFAQVADEHWQRLDELPIDLQTLSLLNPSQPMRSSDPTVNATLRRLRGEHQAWQKARIDPNWMYLRDKGGQKVVLSVVELGEPGLVPNL